MSQYNRREFVRVAGVTAPGVAVAGCAGDGEDETEAEGIGDDGNVEDGSGNDGGSPTYVDEEPEYDGWFDNVDNYEGTLDYTDADEVQVAVGALDGLRFDPPAIVVSSDTTVVWEWTGEGGDHNVVDEGGAFESEIVNEEGHTFEHTFANGGTYRYVCTPHREVGMKGAVVVE